MKKVAAMPQLLGLERHGTCLGKGCAGMALPGGWRHPTYLKRVDVRAQSPQSTGATMRWTKPEAEIVAVTMEVTAYVATL